MTQGSRSTQQWVIAGLGGTALVGGLYFISQVLDGNDGTAAFASTGGVAGSLITDRTSAASPEMSWINNAGRRVETLEDTVRRQEAALTNMQTAFDKERERDAKETDEMLARYEERIAALQGKLEQGGTGVSNTANAANTAGTPGGELFKTAAAIGPGLRMTPLNPGAQPQENQRRRSPFEEGAASTNDVSFDQTVAVTPSPMVRNFELTAAVEGTEETDKTKRLKDYLPAGSYAPAVVLSGVDASTGVSSQAEPLPVVFRVTGPAITAATRSTRGHKVNLKGCTVTGSARGDLSSERVLVRLIRMSCVHPNGDVFEEEVRGYMSGSGKAGTRGLVVSREGKLTTNAAIAGALGGLAAGASSVAGAGTSAENADFNEALSAGGAAAVSGGISGAADKLSEYYIERAEQYQPVVSLYGGTAVELVFMEGVALR